MPAYLTTKEVAARLHISRERVCALIHRGRLPAAKFGHVWMIEPGALAAVEVRRTGWPKGRKRGSPTFEHKKRAVAGRVARRKARKGQSQEQVSSVET